MSADGVRVRFPPSPTGYCHVGTARMALLNYLYAKKHGGTIALRIEDTDKERSTKEFEHDIVESITWLGLTWDEFTRQSERTDIYRSYVQKLLDDDKAYISDEESKKQPGEMTKVIRLRNPGAVITFTDIVRGDITFDTQELGDFVIARSIDDPLYHLTVVVDDAEMNITHVIRGEEHISNTPRQILIQEALGFVRPQYAHYPLFLSADRAKLSKRKGDVAVNIYREKGFLPEAIINYIGMLGWTPPSEREVMTLADMVAEFELEDLHKSGAVFDIEKLRWYNRHYLLAKSSEEFAAYALPPLEEAITSRGGAWSVEKGRRVLPVIRERISVAEDITMMAEEGEFDYYFAEPDIVPKQLPYKGGSTEIASRHLGAVHEMLAAADEEIFSDPERLKNVLWSYAEQEGRGDVLWPLRYALSGKQRSPDPFLLASILGKETTLNRIKAARAVLTV